MIDPISLASTALRPFAGTVWRQQAPAFDPRSGEGARLRGGRFNPPESFPVLYLCTTRPCAIAEMRRLADRQGLSVGDLLPRSLWRYELQLERCLDLTDALLVQGIGVEPDVLVGSDWSITQQIGTAAHALGIQGILSRSATGVDTVLAVFTQNLGLASIVAELAEQWTEPDVLCGNQELQ